MIDLHRVEGVQVIRLPCTPQLFVGVVRHPAALTEVLRNTVLDLAQHGDVLTHRGDGLRSTNPS